MRQLNLFGAPDSPPVKYWPGFLSSLQADELLSQSLELDWQQNQITMFVRLWTNENYPLVNSK
jgi:hypothetical protein